MTMKTKKTLQHIAAVAVVLLTLCLVFASPVSAAPFTTTVVVGEDTCNTLEEAISAATVTGIGTTISLPEYGCEFTLASDGQFYIDADQKTGRMVYLTIAKAGSSAVGDGTLFNVSTTGEVLLTNQNIHKIMLNSESRLNSPGTLLKNGDILLFPAATIYDDCGAIVDTYGDITFIGAGADKTVICPVSIYDGSNDGIPNNGYRYFRLYNRYADNIQSGDIYQFIIKNLTFDGQYNKGANLNTFVVTCYNIEITAENVVFKNFPGSVFSVWANDKLSDDSYPTKEQNVGVEINLVNVTAKENGRLIHFDPRPYKDDVTNSNDRYGFIKLTYDEQSVIENPQLYSINADVALYQGNMLINGEDVTLDSAVAKIGEKYYGTLQDAVNAAAENDVITLLKNIDVDTGVLIEKSLTITSEAGKKYTISNYNVESGNNGATIVVNKDNIALNLENVIVTANHYAIRLLNKSTVEITNSEINGYSALYFKEGADGSTVTVSKSTLVGTDKWSGIQDDFGTIVSETGNVTVTVTDSTVKAIAEGTANQSIVLISDWYAPNNNNKVIFTGGELVLEKGSSPASTFVVINTSSTGNSVVVNAGVTANFNPSAYIAGGMEVVQPGDKYLVQKYVDRSSSSSSSKPVEEPEQPEEPVVEPETPAAPGEVASSTEVTDGGEVAFETTVVDDETGEQSAPAPADEEIKGVVLPTGTEGTVEFVPVSEQAAPAGQEENTKRVFEINVPNYEKGKAAVIKFQMTIEELAADGKEAADVALWHFDEETGEWTKLVTTFTIVDGVVYFEAITEDFSPFAIIYEDEPAGDMPGNEPQDKPETPESPAPVLGLLAALGAAVVLRRK